MSLNGRPLPSGIRTYTTQNAVGANGNGTAVPVSGGELVRITTLGATVPVMNVVLEFSDDNGATWFNIFAQDLVVASGIGTLVNTLAISTTKTQSMWTVPPGVNLIRTRVSGFVSGTVTCIVYVLSNR